MQGTAATGVVQVEHWVLRLSVTRIFSLDGLHNDAREEWRPPDMQCRRNRNLSLTAGVLK
jgi:hypothetical protein